MGQKKRHRKKPRRSQRRELAIPIRVFGTSLRGREFSEDCVSVRVSRHGARIRLKHLLIADDVIRIVNLRKNKDGTFRVIGQCSNPPDASYCDWGVEAEDPNQEIWN